MKVKVKEWLSLTKVERLKVLDFISKVRGRLHAHNNV